MFGYDVPELLGQSMEILVPEAYRGHHAGHHKTFFAAAKSRPMGIGLDLEGRRKDGSRFPVEIGLSVINTRTGTLGVAFVMDITERRRLDQSLRQRDQELAVLFDQLSRLAGALWPGYPCHSRECGLRERDRNFIERHRRQAHP